MVIETTTFRLAAGADEEAFVALDAQLQCDFAYQQPGLGRRTIARGVGDRSDEWVVVQLWGTLADAEAAEARWREDALAQQYRSYLDDESIEVRRYTDFER